MARVPVVAKPPLLTNAEAGGLSDARAEELFRGVWTWSRGWTHKRRCGGGMRG
jgi:hypothetical protein